MAALSVPFHSVGDLIRVLKWYVDRIIDAEHQEQIQQVLKAAEYLFKYIVQSRMLYAAATAAQAEEEFRCSVHELFKSIHLFLSHQSKGISPVTHTQAVFLRSFPTVCCELLKVFSVREVANLARDTLSSLPANTHTECPLQAVKLQCMAKTVESPLYTNTESRHVLLPVVLHLLHTYLQEQKELVLCANILTSMLSLVHKDPTTECVVSEEVNVIMDSLSGVLLKTILEVTNRPQPAATSLRLQYQDVTGEFVACLLTLLRQLSDKDYQQLLSHFSNKDELANFLLQLFTVFRILIRPDMFPKDWTVMRLVTNNVIITTVLYLSDTLRNNFLNEKFDFKVWESYFYLSIIFIIQPCLQLEMFPPSKRKKVLEKYGDMRVMIGCEIFSMWQNLGDYKVNLIPSLIGPFLEVTLVPQPDLRNVLIPVFHDMMDSEERRSGNFKQVEAKLIDKLESLMSEGKGDETYKELFNNIIPLFGPYPSLLKKIERETWRESGVSHIATVTRLMERLLDYRDCMKIGEVDGKKIGCTVNLLNFYKTELNKEEMYIRYIHKLYELHLKAQNFTVPAPLADDCTMQDYMHADSYDDITKDCNGVVPDCHGVTQNGRGSSSVTSPALGLAETTNKSMCGATVVRDNSLLSHATRPECLVSLHLHPYCTLCRNCENVQAAWDGLSQDTIGNLYSSMLRRLQVVLADMAARHHTERLYF
ncbi:hypothetical protein NFI96_002959 [Prochilodus magdalenae]|nr:hypothetical protein NFI96_002959 [Prochilodus magdalenae]